MQEMQVRSLGREDSPGEGNGNPLQHSCLGKSHGLKEPDEPDASRGRKGVGHNFATKQKQQS